MTREKDILKEPDMFKERREGLSNTLAVMSGPDTQDHTLAYLFLDKK